MTNYNRTVYRWLFKDKTYQGPSHSMQELDVKAFSIFFYEASFAAISSVPTFVFQYRRTTVTENAEAFKHSK